MSDRRYTRLLGRTGGGNLKLGKDIEIVNGRESDPYLELAFPSI